MIFHFGFWIADFGLKGIASQSKIRNPKSKLAIQILQRHLEKKLVTASMLEKSDF